ncbi:MAG: hypothetical protein ACJATK_000058 [Paracoccaceae bacterium]
MIYDKSLKQIGPMNQAFELAGPDLLMSIPPPTFGRNRWGKEVSYLNR